MRQSRHRTHTRTHVCDAWTMHSCVSYHQSSSVMSATPLNERFIIAARPVGEVSESTYTLESIAYPTINDGQVLIKATYISVDPMLRGTLAKATPGTGQVSGVVGVVVESKSDKYAVGDATFGYLPWARYIAADASGVGTMLTKIDATNVPASAYLGVLGM
jgi:NADPH-dependent curcumin reductase CurA